MIYLASIDNLMNIYVWSFSVQANGYTYEIIGGQHNFLACKDMRVKYPDREIFSKRRCQVYHGDISFEAKAYLGVINNRIGELRREGGCCIIALSD